MAVPTGRRTGLDPVDGFARAEARAPTPAVEAAAGEAEVGRAAVDFRGVADLRAVVDFRAGGVTGDAPVDRPAAVRVPDGALPLEGGRDEAEVFPAWQSP